MFDQLINTIRRIESLSDQERRAISEHDFQRVIELTREKETLSEDFYRNFKIMQSNYPGKSLSEIIECAEEKDRGQLVQLQSRLLEFKQRCMLDKVIIQKRLQAHYQSYHFWCDVLGRVQSGYDLKGKKTQGYIYPQKQAKA